MPFDGFYKDKTALLTGATGVKGTWLALALLEAGAHVVGLDIRRPDECPNFLASGLSEKMDLVQGDVADPTLMQHLMDNADVVFHLAAVSLVGEALRNPLEAYRTNTLGTATVLDAFRRSERAQRSVLVTTDKVYRPKERRAWVETDPLFASGPYPVSKACAEHVISDYHHTFLLGTGKRLGIARAGNVIIGGDFNSSRQTKGAGRLFADCYDALMNDIPPIVYSPAHRRPYAYGLDIVAGYMTLMSRLDSDDIDGSAFNFGPQESEGTKNSQVASRICELWGDGLTWQPGPPRSEPFVNQAISWEKARRQLEWQPACTLEDTLRETTAWYRAWHALGEKNVKGCLLDFNLEQIRAHRDCASRAGVTWALQG